MFTSTLEDIAKTPETLDIKFIDDKLKKIKSVPIDEIKETIYEKMIEWSILLDRNKGIEENRRERLQMITRDATQMQALQIAPILHIVGDPNRITTIELAWDRTVSKQLEDDNPGKLLGIHLQFLRDVGFNVLPQMIPFLCLTREGPQEIWSLCVDYNFIVINGVPISTPVSLWERLDETCSFLYVSGEVLSGFFYRVSGSPEVPVDRTACPRWIDLLCSRKNKEMEDLTFRAESDKDSDWVGQHRLFCDDHGFQHLVYFATLKTKKDGTMLREIIANALTDDVKNNAIKQFWAGLLSRFDPYEYTHLSTNVNAGMFFGILKKSLDEYVRRRYNEAFNGQPLDHSFNTLGIPLPKSESSTKIIRIYVMRLIAWIFEAPYLQITFSPKKYGTAFKDIAELKKSYVSTDTLIPKLELEPENDTRSNQIRIQSVDAVDMGRINPEYPEILLELYEKGQILHNAFWNYFLNLNINPVLGGAPIFILEKGKVYRSLFVNS